MRALLRNTLAKECDKHIQRHFEYLKELQDYSQRRSRREGNPFKKRIYRPRWWRLHPRFDPFKVRTTKKLNTYAHALAAKLRRKTYKPEPALIHFVPKADGSLRRLNIFQLPDAAVSLVVYKSLLHKNLPRLSGYAFAYREDRTPHDAVNGIFAEWKNLDRVYVAEYDFSKFFDEISHEYLLELVDQHNFIASGEERHVIEGFLRAKACERKCYPQGAVERRRGIPQGTSISLFLANLACWELDRGLERLGVGFCRYADDTVIWSEDYDRVVKAYYLIDECSRKMGVPINLIKSCGINLVSRICGKAEISCKPSIDYLGYRISPEHISIAESKVRKIKSRISFLLYQNLIQPLKAKGIFNAARLTPSLDLDYATALRQIRFYLYGGLTDEKLRSYIAGKVPDLHFRGVMSYYPIVTDIKQLAKLDGWLAYTLRQSLRLREKLWQSRGVHPLPGPCLGWVDQVGRLTAGLMPDGRRVDLTIPRFTLINSAIRAAISRKGIKAVASPRSSIYY